MKQYSTISSTSSLALSSSQPRFISGNSARLISIERTAAPPVSSRPCKHGIRELVGMTCVRSVAARLKLELSSPTTVDTLASRSPAASEAEALPDCPSSTGLQPTPATLFVKTVQSTSFNSFCSARTKPAPKAELQSSTSCGGSHPPAGLKTLKAVSLPLPLSATITGRSLSHSNRQKPHQTALPRPVNDSCLSFVEDQYPLNNAFFYMHFSLKEWRNHGREVAQSGKRVMQALVSEGFEDTLELMSSHNQSGQYGFSIVRNLIENMQYLLGKSAQ
ncbi:hypothetical protein BLNAU_19901 [Blattamonas nauphoetae]|uniref:Uncharacterized protein n=1 Tax=Blattamonas nauphoetae TaxID=2049346 RepID=A0ABQ9X2K5_9EUKA|nr:hypothetical protein BLNAU_19901 [Blattamonas nauphoetae]